jgi:hypothetical protein
MGILEIDQVQAHINILSSIFLYGDALSEDIRFDMEEEINEMWNAPRALVWVDNYPFLAVFKVEVFLFPDLSEEDVRANKNPRNNYIRVEEFAYGNISFVDGLGSNTGYFKKENLYKGSTTAAHEYGHTLGLPHPLDLDLRGKGQPGIMYPRGTIVDPSFQYDPSVSAGAYGGTMHPKYRKVYQEDIDLLNLANKVKRKESVLGKFSMRYHYPHLNNDRPAKPFGIA